MMLTNCMVIEGGLKSVFPRHTIGTNYRLHYLTHLFQVLESLLIADVFVLD